MDFGSIARCAMSLLDLYASRDPWNTPETAMSLAKSNDPTNPIDQTHQVNANQLCNQQIHPKSPSIRARHEAHAVPP